MTRPRAFRYNVRRRNQRRSGIVPFMVLMILLGVAVLAILPSRIPRRDAAQSGPDAQYESWSPPRAGARRATDRDLAQLQAWLEEADQKLYAGTFPDIQIDWSDDHGDAYAYARNDQIRFVRSKFYPGWSGNRDVVMHEMAHVATLHDHDIIWDQERARLAEGRRVMTFEQVRAASR